MCGKNPTGSACEGPNRQDCRDLGEVPPAGSIWTIRLDATLCGRSNCHRPPVKMPYGHFQIFGDHAFAAVSHREPVRKGFRDIRPNPWGRRRVDRARRRSHNQHVAGLAVLPWREPSIWQPSRGTRECCRRRPYHRGSALKNPWATSRGRRAVAIEFTATSGGNQLDRITCRPWR